MPDQVGIINDALAQISEREITAAELSGGTTESARVMASFWPTAVDYCLSLAPWRFASRLASLTYLGSIPDDDPAAYAAPGFTRAFLIPADHLRTNWLRDRPEPSSLPIDFLLQDGFWHTNTENLYASYVSHQYRPPETWPPMFGRVTSSYMAWQRGPRIRPAADANELRLTFEATLDQAKTADASETPFAWHAPGRLVRARMGGWCGENGRRW